MSLEATLPANPVPKEKANQMTIVRLVEEMGLRRRYNWGTSAMKTFKDEIHQPSSVLYPYSRTHVTPATVFGKNVVTFVDHDSLSIAKLREAGLNAIQADVKTFDPRGEKYDLILFLQPELGARHVISHLAEKGHVLTNAGDYTAEELLFERGGFTLLGYVKLRGGGLSKNASAIMPILRKSWEEYQNLQKAFKNIEEDFETFKAFFPSDAVRSTFNLRDMLVLRKDT